VARLRGQSRLQRPPEAVHAAFLNHVSEVRFLPGAPDRASDLRRCKIMTSRHVRTTAVPVNQWSVGVGRSGVTLDERADLRGYALRSGAMTTDDETNLVRGVLALTSAASDAPSTRQSRRTVRVVVAVTSPQLFAAISEITSSDVPAAETPARTRQQRISPRRPRSNQGAGGYLDPAGGRRAGGPTRRRGQ
jgi:hypothetical protein